MPTRRVLLLVLAAALAGCADRGLEGKIVTSGHIEATEIRIATKVAGRLQSFEAEEGTRLVRGQEIAVVDTTDLHLAHRAALADRGQAAAELALRLAGARAEDKAEARAGVDQARAELDGAEKDLKRMVALLEAGSGTEKTRDDAETRRNLAAGRLDAARERLQRLVNGSRTEEIAAARARVEAADARVAQIRQQLEDAHLSAPRDAVLIERLAEPGELLPAGAPVALLVDLEHPWLTIYLAEPDLAAIRIDHPVTVVADGGARREGRVTFISPQAEFTPKNVQTRDERVKLVFKAKVSLPNGDGLWKPGMPAEAHIQRIGGTR